MPALNMQPKAQSSEPHTPPPVLRIVEALLFVGGAPLTSEIARSAIRGLTVEDLETQIAQLNRDYRRQGRPYEIVRKDAGHVLALRPRFQGVVSRLSGQMRATRLSAAAIDVLSLVAYRQPVTKQEIESLRGLESGSLLRLLVRKGLVELQPKDQAGRREASYRTTEKFLDLFKLKNLDDLPQTQDLQKL